MPNVLQKIVSSTLVNATVVTTAETQILYSGRVSIPFATIRAVIKAWIQMSAGTAATGIRVQVRRGNGVAGTLLGSTLATTVVAGNIVELSYRINEQLSGFEGQDYSVTVTQVAATGNGTVQQAQIEVEMING